MGNMRHESYEIKEIQSHIVEFVTNNPNCNVRTMISAVAKTQKISPTRVMKIYKPMIYDKNSFMFSEQHGMIVVTKPKGFRGGNEAFQLNVRKTTYADQIKEIEALLLIYNQNFKKYMPNVRQNKLLTKKVIDGHKFQFINKKYVADFNALLSLIDTVYQRVSALAMANALGVTPKGYDKRIEKLQQATMGWIILEINLILDGQSKKHDVTRWNILINIRLRLEWLIVFEYRKPDLFFKGDWLKDGVIYGMS